MQNVLICAVVSSIALFVGCSVEDRDDDFEFRGGECVLGSRPTRMKQLAVCRVSDTRKSAKYNGGNGNSNSNSNDHTDHSISADASPQANGDDPGPPDWELLEQAAFEEFAVSCFGEMPMGEPALNPPLEPFSCDMVCEAQGLTWSDNVCSVEVTVSPLSPVMLAGPCEVEGEQGERLTAVVDISGTCGCSCI